MYAVSKFLIAENQKIYSAVHMEISSWTAPVEVHYTSVVQPPYRGLSYTIFHCHWC